jgi:hypothetical protein
MPPGHAKLYKGFPPLAFAVAEPLLAPGQVSFVEARVMLIAVGCEMLTVAVAEQRFASETVTVNVAALRPVLSAVVRPLLQLKV